jgi:dihydrofolate reductase
MPISIIAALDQNHLIGNNGKLPWYLPDDLARFKKLTINKTVVMGRKTFESIGKPLSERRNIVLSRNLDLKIPGCEVYQTLPAELLNQELFIIGGGSIYQTFLSQATKLYLTIIHHTFIGDCYFPEWKKSQWQEIEREDFVLNKNNPIAFSFITMQSY